MKNPYLTLSISGPEKKLVIDNTLPEAVLQASIRFERCTGVKPNRVNLGAVEMEAFYLLPLMFRTAPSADSIQSIHGLVIKWEQSEQCLEAESNECALKS